SMQIGVARAAIHREIAVAVGVSEADVALMDARLSSPEMSLNAPSHDGDTNAGIERQDFLIDKGPLPDEVVGEAIDGERRVR
ncbi:hypothetical protein, partial [Klebsiella pneumoniae]|uniref:hypothetical protein n=1 Tax=Klebsiella pneumoniae TaxID=573 RepID=UPI0019532386